MPPSAFHGLSVVQISDIHHGFFFLKNGSLRQYSGKLVETGHHCAHWDFCHIFPAISDCGGYYLGVFGRYGVFAVLGTTISVWTPKRLLRHLRGSALMCCAIDTLRYGFVGVDIRIWSRRLRVRADLRRAMRGVPREAATILLDTIPGSTLPPVITSSLVFPGNTHGGQVNLPCRYCLRPFARAVAL